MLRLNVAVPPASNPNPLGILGGDLAGFPNGRRVIDDVTTISLRAVAGLTYPLVNKGYEPDEAAEAVTDGHPAPVGPLPGDVPLRRHRRTTGSTSRRRRNRGGAEQMHSHGHSHTHSHATATEENHAARRHPEHVVLDIGEDIGALILHTDAEMLGVEVEISATGHDDRRSHKDVLEREINGRPAYTAVFDNSPRGHLHALGRRRRARARRRRHRRRGLRTRLVRQV